MTGPDHKHEHTHDDVTHVHEHSHDDAHHQHSHPEGETTHSHEHTHAATTHEAISEIENLTANLSSFRNSSTNS